MSFTLREWYLNKKKSLCPPSPLSDSAWTSPGKGTKRDLSQYLFTQHKVLSASQFWGWLNVARHLDLHSGGERGADTSGSDCVMGTWASQPPPAPRDGRLRGWSWGAWVRLRRREKPVKQRVQRALIGQVSNACWKRHLSLWGKWHYPGKRNSFCSYIVEFNLPPSEGMEMISYYK